MYLLTHPITPFRFLGGFLLNVNLTFIYDLDPFLTFFDDLDLSQQMKI